ncbi:MAG: hypothetical protein Q8R12_02750 [bacterium]|nr:hypothetical protein [bacterium]
MDVGYIPGSSSATFRVVKEFLRKFRGNLILVRDRHSKRLYLALVARSRHIIRMGSGFSAQYGSRAIEVERGHLCWEQRKWGEHKNGIPLPDLLSWKVINSAGAFLSIRKILDKRCRIDLVGGVGNVRAFLRKNNMDFKSALALLEKGPDP